mgnify:CR=1 FL=1
MIEKIQHATASSPEGAKGLVKGVLACAFQNMAFMLPTGLLYLLVKICWQAPRAEKHLLSAGVRCLLCTDFTDHMVPVQRHLFYHL